MYKLRRPLLLTAIIALLHSCNTSQSGTEDLSLKVHAGNGSKYQYTITTESISEEEVEAKKTRTKNGAELNLLYECTKDSADGTHFDVTYEKMKLFMGSGIKATELDVATAIENAPPQNRYINAFDHAKLNAVISASGKVKQINGIKSITDKMYEIAATNVDALDDIKNTWDNDIGKFYFEKTIQYAFALLPDSAVKTGVGWVANSSVTVAGIELPVVIKYTLTAIKNDKAFIDVNAEILSENETKEIQGVDVVINLKGSQKGTIVLNTNTGMVIESENKMLVKGTMQVKSTNIDLNCSNTVKIKGRKL